MSAKAAIVRNSDSAEHYRSFAREGVDIETHSRPRTQAAGQPVLAQLMVSHPNDSGLAMDQVTRTYATPHFVRQVDVSYAGKPVMRADVDFSISENPNFRFYFVPTSADAGELKANVVDNQDLAFATSVRLDAVRGASASMAP